MEKDLWLPQGHELPDGSKIHSLLYSGNAWQMFDTNGSNNILLTHLEVVQKWDGSDFLDKSLFEEVSFGKEAFLTLSSHKKYVLAPVDSGSSLGSKVAALAFVLALKESRKLSKE